MKSATYFVLSLLVIHLCYTILTIKFPIKTAKNKNKNDEIKFPHDPPIPPQKEELLFVLENATLLPPPHEAYPFSFNWKWHPENRSERFPSVEQRVKLYMSNWYLPPCNSNSQEECLQHRIELVGDDDDKKKKWPRAYISSRDNNNHTVELDSIVNADRMFMLDRDTIRDCARGLPEIKVEGLLSTEERVKKRNNLRSYCRGVMGLIDYVNGLDEFTPRHAARQEATPIICQFGDGHAEPTTPPLPVIAKWRASTTPTELQRITSQTTCSSSNRPALNATVNMYSGIISPIIWKLNTRRHWHWDALELARMEDTKWQEKKLGALWRGDLTGRHNNMASGAKNNNELECFANQRCRFVFDYRNSKLINAGLTNGLNWLQQNNGTVSGAPVIKGRVTMQQIQQYKVIVSLEGNDVASGLKWSLLSESVVLMPAPTRTSWAMEELLEPWVHYIPMHENGSNAEEMIQWVGNHDEEAKKIGQRGRLFMYDLIYHPDAAREEREVKAEIARRYHTLFQQ